MITRFIIRILILKKIKNTIKKKMIIIIIIIIIIISIIIIIISIFIKILVYDSEMGKDFVNRFFFKEN